MKMQYYIFKSYLKIGNLTRRQSPSRKRGAILALKNMDSLLRGNDERERTDEEKDCEIGPNLS